MISNNISGLAIIILLAILSSSSSYSFISSNTKLKKTTSISRRSAIQKASITAITLPLLCLSTPVLASPEIFTTNKGVKYAITKK